MTKVNNIVVEDDPVNHPSHYTQGKYETKDMIHSIVKRYRGDVAWDLGSCIKYIDRAGLKDPTKLIQDLEKARWFLDDAISLLKEDAEEIPFT